MAAATIFAVNSSEQMVNAQLSALEGLLTTNDGNSDDPVFHGNWLQHVQSLQNLATTYFQMGNIKKSIGLYDRVLQLVVRNYGPDHLTVSDVLTSLGAQYSLSGDAATARRVLERALWIKENHYGPDHSQCVGNLIKLSAACTVAGDFTKGGELMNRAMRIEEAQRNRTIIHQQQSLLPTTYATSAAANDETDLLVDVAFFAVGAPLAFTYIKRGKLTTRNGPVKRPPTCLHVNVFRQYYGQPFVSLWQRVLDGNAETVLRRTFNQSLGSLLRRL
jgi:tetratricopeptide (TPR) repeat protein